MFMKNKLLLLFIFLIVHTSFAQQNVLASGGDNTTTNGTASYSVGLIHYKSATGPGGTSSTGTQVPFEIVQQLSIDENQIITLQVYPNPTSNNIYIVSKQLENLAYSLFDNSGRLLLKGEINELKTLVPLDQLSAAFYILNITQNNRDFKSYKIIKK